MGGCPFVPGAAGNIATEDLVNLLHTCHFETGVDIEKLARCSRRMEVFFEKRFSGRMHRLIKNRIQGAEDSRVRGGADGL